MEKTIQAVMQSFPRLREIADTGLREKVCRAWLTVWQASGYERLEDASQWEPARESLGISNVDHTNGVVDCALAMADALRRSQSLEVDRDVLIAAALLHDLDKLLLFRGAGGPPTELGKRIGHVLAGVHLTLAAGLPPDVVHAVAAHSPNYSSLAPQTAEAIILKHADKVVTDLWILQRGQDVTFTI
jgi:7,8-dihydroneopterin 2',3'-cyclic phosphate phosphodiesterase